MTTHNRDQHPPQGWADETEFHLPEDHWPLPELVHTEKPHGEPTTASFIAISKTPEYQNLRSTFRRFAFFVLLHVALVIGSSLRSGACLIGRFLAQSLLALDGAGTDAGQDLPSPIERRLVDRLQPVSLRLRVVDVLLLLSNPPLKGAQRLQASGAHDEGVWWDDSVGRLHSR